jgi:hypothetical protein
MNEFKVTRKEGAMTYFKAVQRFLEGRKKKKQQFFAGIIGIWVDIRARNITA